MLTVRRRLLRVLQDEAVAAIARRVCARDVRDREGARELEEAALAKLKRVSATDRDREGARELRELEEAALAKLKMGRTRIPTGRVRDPTRERSREEVAALLGLSSAEVKEIEESALAKLKATMDRIPGDPF